MRKLTETRWGMEVAAAGVELQAVGMMGVQTKTDGLGMNCVPLTVRC